MALKGNLRDFSITQLLNLVHLAQKTGTLVINGPQNVALLNFREGKLAYAQLGQDGNNLGAILLRNHRISPNQYRILKERAANMPENELGLLLVNAGYLSQDDILVSMQQYFTSIIRQLFTWLDGVFRFDPEITLPSDKIPVHMQLENLIIEGSRQVREWEQLQDEIPSLDIALRFPNHPGTNIRNINLSVDEWKVISYVNPKNTLRQIARVVSMNELEIRRVVYSLLQAGLVELIRPAAVPVMAPGIMLPNTTRSEKKSLINRLIARIRSI